MRCTSARTAALTTLLRLGQIVWIGALLWIVAVFLYVFGALSISIVRTSGQ